MHDDDRPLSRLGIVELEEMFALHEQDATTLEQILHELKHRTTARAGLLRQLAERALEVAQARPPVLSGTAEPESRQAELLEFEDADEGTLPPDDDISNVMTEADAAAPSDDVSDAGPVNDAIDVEPVKVEPRGNAPSTPPPPLTNRPEDILSSWIALEVLSPPTFEKPDRLAGDGMASVAEFKNGRLPWEGEGEKGRKGYKLPDCARHRGDAAGSEGARRALR